MDNRLRNAVRFARHMIEEDFQEEEKAIQVAADYYCVDEDDIVDELQKLQ